MLPSIVHLYHPLPNDATEADTKTPVPCCLFAVDVPVCKSKIAAIEFASLAPEVMAIVAYLLPLSFTHTEKT